MQGIIIRGVGGFYYALDAQGQTHQLRAQAKLRRARLKPMVGDQVEFGGLLGRAPVMPVHEFSSAAFIRRGGRIPAPLNSLKN